MTDIEIEAGFLALFKAMAFQLALQVRDLGESDAALALEIMTQPFEARPEPEVAGTDPDPRRDLTADNLERLVGAAVTGGQA